MQAGDSLNRANHRFASDLKVRPYTSISLLPRLRAYSTTLRALPVR